MSNAATQNAPARSTRLRRRARVALATARLYRAKAVAAPKAETRRGLENMASFEVNEAKRLLRIAAAARAIGE